MSASRANNGEVGLPTPQFWFSCFLCKCGLLSRDPPEPILLPTLCQCHKDNFIRSIRGNKCKSGVRRNGSSERRL